MGQAITTCKLFEEDGGLLVMEVESVLPADSWGLRTDISGALGEGYYEWKHGDNSQGIDPAGSGVLTYSFTVSQAGSYRFLLRSSSPDNTEHNDVWVRFPDNPATGIRQSGPGSIDIRPNSWFKVYQNTSGQEWKWDARTVDFDPHAIYAVIDEPGTYSVQLSGRSTLFKIDRLVLYTSPVSFVGATRLDNPESVCLETKTLGLRQPDEPNAPLPGIHYAYYEGEWRVLPDFTELFPVKTGIADGFDISLSERSDYFGFLFEGYIQAPEDGLYTFYTISNAGSQLFVGDDLVVGNDSSHAARERSGFIGLTAGWHKVAVLYFEDFFNQSLSVLWTPPGGGKQMLGEGTVYYGVDNLYPSAQLEGFNGIPERGGVSLNWETASELSNAGFEIERRYTGTTQAAVDTTAFVPIAFVEGNGTTTSPTQYAYMDASILATATVVDYRMKLVGESGSFTYSDIVTVELPKPESVRLYPIYPNPSSAATTLSFDLVEESPVVVSLYNAAGQLVDILLNEIRQAGRNEVTINVPALTSGVYIYRLETPEGIHTGTMTRIK